MDFPTSVAAKMPPLQVRVVFINRLVDRASDPIVRGKLRIVGCAVSPDVDYRIRVSAGLLSVSEDRQQGGKTEAGNIDFRQEAHRKPLSRLQILWI